MSFVVKKIDYRAWPVTVKTQECDASGVVSEREQTFICHFRALGEGDYESIVRAVDLKCPVPDGAGEIGSAVRSGMLVPALRQRREAEFWRRAICGWGSDVTDESGAPLPFSEDVLADLILGPDGAALVRAFAEALTQIRNGSAPEKNLPTSPVPGPQASEAAPAPTNSPPTSMPGESGAVIMSAGVGVSASSCVSGPSIT